MSVENFHILFHINPHFSTLFGIWNKILIVDFQQFMKLYDFLARFLYHI